MSPDLLFRVCNTAILPGWLVLAVAPGWKWGSRFLCPIVIPGLLGLVYVGIVISKWANMEGSFNSLVGVEKLFTNRWALVGGWIHYLAFDLFIGSWETRDAERHQISRWLLIPCLLLTCLFGPAGLLLYLVVRMSVCRETFLHENPRVDSRRDESAIPR